MAANKPDFSKIYEKITDQIIAEMEKGIIPWKKEWKAISGAYNAKNNKYYSFLNQMVLYRPGAYASFKQWQELNCKVKKGAKADYIIEWFFKTYTFTETDPDTQEETERKFNKWYPRMFPVFHESQVEGYEGRTKEEIKPADPIDAAEKIIEAYKSFSGISKIITDKESDKAFYSPIRDYIQVPTKDQFETIESYYATLFHEMTHSTGHSSRLNRGLDKELTHFGSESYSKEELTAELGSAMIMARLGIDTPATFKNSAAYLQAWLCELRNDKTLIVSAASYAEAATRYIFHETINA